MLRTLCIRPLREYQASKRHYVVRSLSSSCGPREEEGLISMKHLDPSSVSSSSSQKSIPEGPGVGGLLGTSSEGLYGTYLSSSDPVGGGSRYGAGVFADAIIVPVGASEVTAASSSFKEASVAEVSTCPTNSQRYLILV